VSELAKVPFLANLEAADLDALAQRMERREYEAGDLIYAEGTEGEGLYYVEAGTVAVLTNASCDGEVMAHLPKGSTFGEAALISSHPRSNAVRAATDATIMVLTRTAFQEFLAEHPGAGQVVTQTLMQRPARSARRIVAEVLRPAPLFTGVADDALLALARTMQPVQLRANSIVFADGDAPDALYLVENGAVSLLSSAATGRVTLAEIRAHDFFGEDALLTDQPREVSALATEAVDLWKLDRADFDAFTISYPGAALSLTRALAARSERLNRQLLAIAAGRTTLSPTAAPQRVTMPVGPVVPVRPAMPVRPRPQRQPLLAGLSSWIGSLSTPAKVRLALIGVLLAWLLLVSLPSAIAASLAGTSQTPVLETRGALSVASSRGGMSARGPLEDLAPATDVVDVADAPLAHLQDLVALKPTATAPVLTRTEVAPSPTATPQPVVTYAIVYGDTLWDIAQRFKVDLDVLIEANKIANPNNVPLGTELVIPGGAEQEEIATRLAAEPKPTPLPVSAPAQPVAAAAAPAAPAAPEQPALPFVWDGRLDKHNIRVEQAQVAAGQQYYRLVKALFKDTNENMGPNMPNGDHNIYIEVLDESGKRIVGAKAIVRNGGTTTLTIENKPFPDYGTNFPMYGMLGSYSAWIDGLPSDKVVGMGLPMKWHVSYFLTFQRTTK